MRGSPSQMFSSCFPTLCLIQQNSLSSLPSLNCSKTWVVIFMGKSRFRLPTSILKFTYSTKLDTCNINSSDQQGWKQTTIFENICSVQEVERQHERGSSNSQVPITVGMSQNVTDQMRRAGQPTVLFQWRSGKRTSKKLKLESESLSNCPHLETDYLGVFPIYHTHNSSKLHLPIPSFPLPFLLL